MSSQGEHDPTSRRSVGVFSMSARSEQGRDAEYLRWHLLDHLPEQYRLARLRGGVRWVSTPECRAARAVSTGRWDRVDHVVNYVAAPGFDPDEFFALGAELAAAGRIPQRLPAVHLGGFRRTAASSAAGAAVHPVSAEVLAWRPHAGVHLVVAEGATGDSGELAGRCGELDGVAGAWTWTADPSLHARFDQSFTGSVTVVYCDDDPVALAPALGEVVRAAGDGAAPVLVAPLRAVVPGEWDRWLP